jgi:glycerol-3-phosphate dehydrogenase (NAD(P)+)
MTGVIGAGSFGTAVANLLAKNTDVLLFSRRPEVVETINRTHRHLEVDLSPRIRATTDLAEVAAQCQLLFPIIPSDSFRRVMQSLAPHVSPHHFIIHGTKGFDLKDMTEADLGRPQSANIRNSICTMSEVIREETSVLRIGCLSGPNLSSEIMAGQPTASLIASRFREVIHGGQQVLNSPAFHVFGSYDLLGVELAGTLKNIIALGSGILGGLGLGRNIQGLLISRGLAEMIYFGKALGTSSQAFLGVAGIGDLVTTATSINSRNYSFGTRIAKGEKLDAILQTLSEPAEGVRTLRIAYHLSRQYKLHTPITTTLYHVIFDGMDIERALKYLITYPYSIDVDFV